MCQEVPMHFILFPHNAVYNKLYSKDISHENWTNVTRNK